MLLSIVSGTYAPEKVKKNVFSRALNIDTQINNWKFNVNVQISIMITQTKIDDAQVITNV